MTNPESKKQIAMTVDGVEIQPNSTVWFVADGTVKAIEVGGFSGKCKSPFTIANSYSTLELAKKALEKELH